MSHPRIQILVFVFHIPSTHSQENDEIAVSGIHEIVNADVIYTKRAIARQEPPFLVGAESELSSLPAVARDELDVGVGDLVDESGHTLEIGRDALVEPAESLNVHPEATLLALGAARRSDTPGSIAVAWRVGFGR
jgi:hypothetical protein